MLKVANTSSPAAVSGAIAGQLRENGYVQVRAVGVYAVCQMLKAIIYAYNHMSDEQRAMQIVPSFCVVEVGEEGEERTAIQCDLSLA